MDLEPQRRMAAKILGVGVHRVWMNSEYDYRIANAIRNEDIKVLIKDKVIRKRKARGVSRGRARFYDEQRRRGLRRGHGNRKGKKTARSPRKRLWINKIRAQRRFLRYLRDNGQLKPSVYREFYRKTKGGFFRSVAHLRSTLYEGNYLEKPRKK